MHSLYEPDGPAVPLRTRLFTGAGTHGWIVITDAARNLLIARYGVKPERVRTIEPAVDTARFGKGPAQAAARTECGLDPADFVVGIVARIGSNRRLELILEAVRLIAPECPRLRCLIVGRGEVDAVINEPAAAMGITDRIVLGGYCRWDRLVTAYRAMNVYVYTTPGTDKSCRAVREAMAAGIPVLARNTGYLPQLVEAPRTGLLYEDDPADLARALKRLYTNGEALQAMGREARDAAAQRFDRIRQARKVAAFYEHLKSLA